MLRFVVADPAEACRPTWGTYYRLDAAQRALDLDRRIVRLRERGGDVVISFGGAINDELAITCTDTAALVEAYRSVIERYHVTVLDFDIEGSAISDGAANERRAEALAKVQQDIRASGSELDLWLTLPVSPGGLTPEAVALVDATLAGGVDLAGVNVMTMNYGGSRQPGQGMHAATVSALEATWRQVDGAYRRTGVQLTAAAVWAKIGATPMIGQNDVAYRSLHDRRRRAAGSFRSRPGYWPAVHVVCQSGFPLWSAGRCHPGLEHL